MFFFKFKNTFFNCIFLFFIILYSNANAQKINYSEEYDEVPTLLIIENIFNVNLNAIYNYNNNQLYLPIIEMFNVLNINIKASNYLDTIQGYFCNENNLYKILINNKKINYKNVEFDIDDSDFIKINKDIYFSLAFYQKIFNLQFNFNFSTLRLYLKSEIELPIIKLYKLEKLHKNINQRSNEIICDTIIYDKFRWMGGAIFDYNLSFIEGSDNKFMYNVRTDLGLELLGGEFKLYNNISDFNKIDWKQQGFNWLWARIKTPYLTQVNVGIINAPLYSDIYSGLFGIKLSNISQNKKMEYVPFIIKRTTNPNWRVELYINDIFWSSTKADEKGQYVFEIPLNYGNYSIVVKLYGPTGEEKIETFNILIPYSLAPKNKLEYQIYSGVSYDTFAYKFIHSIFSYGLTKNITLSAGYESIEKNIFSRHMPFAKLSVTPFNNLFLSYSYVANSFQEGYLMYRLKNGFLINSNIRFYEKNQDALLTNDKLSTSVGLNIPFRIKKLNINFLSQYRFTNFYNLEKQNVHYYYANLSFFTRYFNLGFFSQISMTGIDTYIAGINAYFYLPKQWLIYFNTSIDLSTYKFNFSQMMIQKTFNKFFSASISYNHAFSSNANYIMVNTYFDLNYLRTAFAFNKENNHYNFNQNISGSLIFSNTNFPVYANKNFNVGKCLVDVMLFIDINHNNIKDDNEPLIKNSLVRMDGSINLMPKNDSIHRFLILEPYMKHVISISNKNFQYITWTLDNKNVCIYPEPNQVNKIFIPVKPMGEIQGRVILIDAETEKQVGFSKIIIMIKNNNGNIIYQTLSDQDGYFNYLGLAPGNYSVCLDSMQMNNLGYNLSNYCIDFKINESVEGDYVDNINFKFIDNLYFILKNN
jgi:hypothetical protein